LDACHLLLGRPWQFDKGVIYNGTASTYTFKVNGRNYPLTPLPLNQIQNVKTNFWEGDTSEKTLFLSETRVQRSISKGKPIYALLVLEEGEGETPLHRLAQPLVYEYLDVFPSDLPTRLPLLRGIEHQIDCFSTKQAIL